MMPDDKNCIATLYLTTPAFLLTKKANFFKRDGKNGMSGHAFVGLTDEKGKEQRWGFSAAGSADTKSMLQGCEGCFCMECEETKFTEAVIYPISREQYDAAMKKISEIRSNPKKIYKLLSNNCSIIATSILKAAGVGSKNKAINMCPHTLTLKKRALLAKRRVEVALFKAQNKVRQIFGIAKVPDAKMLDYLRKKPLPAPIKEATRTSYICHQLTQNQLLNNLMNGAKTNR